MEDFLGYINRGLGNASIVAGEAISTLGGASACAAPFVCLACTAVVGRPARRAGNAGPRLDRLDPGLHLARLHASGPGV